jgi:NMD protein affecting ribosome stability and mRNA decay
MEIAMTGTRRGTGQPPRSGQGRFLRGFDRDADPYLAKRKISGPAACPDCKAVYWRGKWTWREAAPKTKAHVCPACQRVRDKVPAAYLTLRGEFRRAHAKEIFNLIHNFEAHERKEHPLKRIMGSEETADAMLFTFTDSHLARGIAEALHHAYQGEVDLQYTTDDVVLRATWTR